MSLAQIIAVVRSLDGALVLAPDASSGFPELAWGDHFFYYAPDGAVPERTQPYATVVTKDYPDDSLSRLDEPGRARLNIHVGRERFLDLTGEDPREEPGDAWDYAADDVVLPHPVYRRQAWVAVVNPGERTTALAIDLLRDAHEQASRRSDRERSR